MRRKRTEKMALTYKLVLLAAAHDETIIDFAAGQRYVLFFSLGPSRRSPPNGATQEIPVSFQHKGLTPPAGSHPSQSPCDSHWSRGDGRTSVYSC